MQRLLKKFLEQFDTPQGDTRPDRMLALAVLLHETARADFDQQPMEWEQIRSELAAHFKLDDGALDALLQQAGQRAQDTASLHRYVSALNDELGPAQKKEIMGMLWRVAYADGRLDPQEEHLVRRLADLMFVPHRDYIETKLAVAERYGAG